MLEKLADSEIAEHCALWGKQILSTGNVGDEIREKWNIYQCDLMLEKFPQEERADDDQDQEQAAERRRQLRTVGGSAFRCECKVGLVADAGDSSRCIAGAGAGEAEEAK